MRVLGLARFLYFFPCLETSRVSIALAGGVRSGDVREAAGLTEKQRMTSHK